MLNKKVYILIIIAVFAICIICLINSVFAAEEINLRVQYWRFSEEPANSVFQEAKIEFEKLYPNIKLTFEPLAFADRLTKLTTQVMGGEAPDVFGLYSPDFPALFELGIIKSLNSYIEESGGKDYTDHFFPIGLEAYTYDGNIYGIPESLDCKVLFYNMKMFEEAGLDPNKPPQDWDTFLEFAKKLTKDTDGDGRIDQWAFGLYGMMGLSAWQRAWPIFWSFGGDVLSSDGENLLTEPASREAFKFIVELLTKHKVVPPNVLEIDYNVAQTMFAQETVAMVQNAANFVGDMAFRNPKMKAGVDYMATAIPVKKGLGIEPVHTVGVTAMSMTNQCKNPDAAWKWISFWSSKEIQAKYIQACYFSTVRKDVAEMPWHQNDPILSSIVKYLDAGREMPIHKDLPQIGDVLVKSLQSAWMEQQTPEQACDSAIKEINKIINR